MHFSLKEHDTKCLSLLREEFVNNFPRLKDLTEYHLSITFPLHNQSLDIELSVDHYKKWIYNISVLNKWFVDLSNEKEIESMTECLQSLHLKIFNLR